MKTNIVRIINDTIKKNLRYESYNIYETVKQVTRDGKTVYVDCDRTVNLDTSKDFILWHREIEPDINVLADRGFTSIYDVIYKFRLFCVSKDPEFHLYLLRIMENYYDEVEVTDFDNEDGIVEEEFTNLVLDKNLTQFVIEWQYTEETIEDRHIALPELPECDLRELRVITANSIPTPLAKSCDLGEILIISGNDTVV